MPFYTVQHKRSDESNRRPGPDDLASGQVAINYNVQTAGLFFKSANDSIVKVGPPILSDDPPNPVNYTELSVGETWVDTSQESPTFCVWNGTEWLEMGPPNIINQDLVPGPGCLYSLGTSDNRWGNLYTCDVNMSNEGGQNEVDGTWGSWSMQEGEEDLFLINRRSGKKYKFLLEEIK